MTKRGIFEQQSLNLEVDDTHHVFSISFNEENLSSASDYNYPECFIYFKGSEHKKEQWYVYDRENSILTSYPVKCDAEEEEEEEETPLCFTEDDKSKAIFSDCQVGIFFIGKSDDRIHSGMIAQSLMDVGVELDTGMCPIGNRAGFPLKVNSALNEILAHHDLNQGNTLLHTLLVGKITRERKYDRTISTVRLLSHYSDILKTYLVGKLPAYMVPSLFITVQTFPIGPTGKIDRKSLSEESSSLVNKEESDVIPSSGLEKKLADMWEELLCSDRVYLHDDFFQLGGNSLLLIQLYQRYTSSFAVDARALAIGPFFSQSTVAGHAKLLETIYQTNRDSGAWQVLHVDEGRRLRKSIVSSPKNSQTILS